MTAGLLWLAFPGGGAFWPLLFVALIPFFLAVFGAGTVRQAGACGGLTGLLHFLVLLYWIPTVLGRYGGLPSYLSVPALVLLALYMSLYMGLFAMAVRLFIVRLPLPLVLWVIPAAWVALDWCRSFLFTGFPWMDPGYALAHVPWVIQTADLWGHYGLTYVLVLINTLAAMLLMLGVQRRGQLSLVVPVVLVCSAVAVYSFLRWQQVERQMAVSESMRIGVVQGNIAQDLKWSPGLQEETLTNYIAQSRGLIDRNHPLLLVWPETALPFYPVAAHPLLPMVRDLAVSGHTSLLTGAPWLEQSAESDSGGQGVTRYYNSALLFDSDGQITNRYSKSHLVPFGEYVPLKRMLPFLAPLVEAVGDFSSGAIEQALACHNARIGVLICFESIFPEIARKWVSAKANVLVNLTNDAWYGRSSAPYQSLAMTVLRSVETRRSLVRAANTGFSGFIDPLGRVQVASPLFEPWAESAEVVLMEGETWFVRWGYLFSSFCLGITILLLIWIALRNPRVRSIS
ncbi:MAG: apolipoprotein N-acyltransferase [Desulfocapsaceae bacterium]|nr:apolipoprotein N-acyltransferase [Desulfocapsaceae bacterium]